MATYHHTGLSRGGDRLKINRARAKNRKPKGIETLKSRYGLIFLSPWLVGMALFFVFPIFQSLYFSFSKLNIVELGVNTEFVGLANLKNILFVNPDYVNNLLEAVRSLFVSMPFTIIISLILALALNGRFHGRLFFRSLFFAIVIISSGPVLELFLEAAAADATEVALSDVVSFGMIDFADMLQGLNLPSTIETYLSVALDNLFMLVWQSGIQILLFIAGLQSIPDMLYEVAKVEGATKWEEFWFITLPMLLHTIFLVVIFTTVEVITLKTNPVMAQGYNQFRNLEFGVGSAMLWFYFAIAGIFIVLIMLLFQKVILKRWG